MPKRETTLYQLIERCSFLSHVPLFCDLDEKYLASIAEIVDEVEIYPGESLFEQGDPGDYVYLIKSGHISIQVEGKEIAVLGEHDCLGEMAIIDGLPRSASAKAKSITQLMRISSDDFRDILLVQPEISLALMRTLARRLRKMR